jgi:hypothetical protein
VEFGLYGVLVAEVVVASYLTYQLIDATIDYQRARAQGERLDAEIAAVQRRIDGLTLSDGLPGCCCLADRSRPREADAWLNSFFGEFSCREQARGYFPLHCYDGRPTQADIAAAGGVAAACAATHRNPRPPRTVLPPGDPLIWCESDPETKYEAAEFAQMLLEFGVNETEFCNGDAVVGYPVESSDGGADGGTDGGT